MVLVWEARGTPQAVQQLNDVINTHQDDIESTTKGPLRSKVKCGAPDNVLVEEEQKVYT